MTGPAAVRSAHPGRWRVLAAALALAGVVCLVMWAARSPSGPSTGSTAPAVSVPGVASGGLASPVGATASAAVLARPVTLSIPSIDLTTRVTRLGLQKDGTVEVPSNPALAGWYENGPPPGEPGSSVILGHVDSMAGPAVFYNLSALHPGDLVAVRLDDGATVRFRVHSVHVYANADFPDQLVYGQHGRSELNLVTCGGVYDSSHGGYQSNVVVNARRT